MFNLSKLIFTVMVLFTCVPVLHAQELPSSPSQRYLYYDQNFNVIKRLRTEEKRQQNLMSEEEKQPLVVGLFEVPVSALGNDLLLSKFISPEDHQKTYSGSEKILIPVLRTQKATWNALKNKFGNPKYETTGLKTLSRATYFINPVADKAGFFAKFVEPENGYEEIVKAEILANDYLHSQLELLPEDMRDLLMDSYMGLTLTLKLDSGEKINHLITYRSAKALETTSGMRVYPAHGLLGCDECVQEYAVKWSGISDDNDKAVARWKQKEFLPKLAKYIAYSHHVLGASFEAHTQNMVMVVDHQSGKIIKFKFKVDDVLFNPIPLLGEGRFPEINWETVRVIPHHSYEFQDPGAEAAKDVWYHASIYTGQAISSHLKGFPRQQRHTAAFIRAYIDETEKIIGEKIPLSEDAQKVIASLDLHGPKEELYSGELQDRSPLRNALASVLKSVFDYAHDTEKKKISSELREISVLQNPEIMKRTFLRALAANKVIFLGGSEKKQIEKSKARYSWLKMAMQALSKMSTGNYKSNEELEFKINDGRIWVIDGASQKPLGVTALKNTSTSMLKKCVSSIKELLK